MVQNRILFLLLFENVHPCFATNEKRFLRMFFLHVSCFYRLIQQTMADSSGSDYEYDTDHAAAITAKVGTDSDVAASKTDTTDGTHSVIVSLSDEQQLQAFAFLKDHPFMWDKSDLVKYKKDKERRDEYWQKLVDIIGISCK